MTNTRRQDRRRWPRWRPVHPPILAAAWVLPLPLAIGAAPAAFVRPLLVTEAAVILLWLVGAAAMRSWRKGALLAAGIGAVVVSYEPITTVIAFLRELFGIGVAIAIAALIVILVSAFILQLGYAIWRGRLPGMADLATSFLNAFGAVLLIIVLAPAIPGAVHWSDRAAAPFAPGADAETAKPDIYLILLDGYPRADELAARFGIDNTAFIGDLEALGFEVDAGSRSNYPNTELTLTALFSGEYVGDPGTTLGRGDLRDRLRSAVLSGQATGLIRAAGYELVSTAPGWEGVTLRSGVDSHIERPEITDLERFILRRTWLPDLPFVPADYYVSDLQKRVVGTLDDAVALTHQLHERPMFAFVHVPAPHLPLAFDADGSPPDVSARRYDLGRRSVPSLSDEEFARAYGDNLEALNKHVLDAVDRLIAESTSPPVVILMSDHGYSGDVSLGQGTILHTLFASFTPQQPGVLANAPTPVNLLSMLMRTFGGVDPGPMVEDRFFAADIDGDLETLAEIDDPQ